MSRTLIWIGIILMTSLDLFAQQDVAIGSWKSYLPYKFGWSVTQSPEAVYYGTQWALMKVNKDDLSLEYFSKVDGLSDVEVRFVQYYPDQDVLMVIYDNSNIDLVFSDQIVNLNQIKANTQIVEDRTINDIYFKAPFAYLATGFGVVQLNIEEEEFGFTSFSSRNIISVNGSEDDLYLSAEDGLYRGRDDGSINLGDFGNWEKLGFAEGLPEEQTGAMLESIDDQLYAGVSNALYQLDNGRFEFIHEEPGYTFQYATQTAEGVLTGWKCETGCPDKKWLFTSSGSKMSISSCAKVTTDAITDEQGRIWYADENRGFKFSEGINGPCQIITPNRPPTHNASQLATQDGVLYVATGGVTINYGYLFRADGFYTNESGTWETFNRSNVDVLSERDMRDFLSIEASPDGRIYVGTFWDGLIEYDNGEVFLFDKDNSSLQNSVINPDRNRITDIEFDSDGNLWALNHDAPRPVSVMTPDGEWYNFPINSQTNVEHLAIDANGYKWISIGGVGLVVFDSGDDLMSTSDDRYRLINVNNSQLESDIINDLATDQDGTVWVGTAEGLVIFECGESAFDANCDGERRIVVENDIPGILLGDENIKAVAVDGGNRKWFGTSNGIFVQSPDGEVQVHAFNVRNSPLFDNNIIDIEIDPLYGEVFIATNKGIQSFRGEATQGGRIHQEEVLVFPNPVRPDYRGPIAIRGLAEGATVKITDVQGSLVYETIALGGQAIWYGEDFNGNRASSGVYLIFSSKTNSFTGPDAAVAKVMLVN